MAELFRGWTIGPTTFAPGTTASLVLPAPAAGVSIIVTDITARIINDGTATQTLLSVQLLDGAAIINSWPLGVQAVGVASDEISFSGMNIVLTPGSALTLNMNAAPAHTYSAIQASGTYR